MSNIGKNTYKAKIGKVYKNRRFCFNDFKVDGDIAYIYFKDNKFIIDTFNLPKINMYIWRIKKRGYVETNIDKKHQLLHRYLLNFPKNKYVDHINRNPLDNRICNLRICSPQESVRNRICKGYSFDSSRNKFIVSIKINRKTKHIGRFETKEEALKARILAEKKYFGEFALKRT